MLYDFLKAERENILALCSAKLLTVSDSRSSSDEMELGLPVFYEELIEILRADESNEVECVDRLSGAVHEDAAKKRGGESLKLGYTISQVVHGYGALCQSITEYAAEHSDEPISAREFNRLNLCLDFAIAAAVTEFSRGQQDLQSQEENQRLGFLAHELRNALANAAMAHQLIKQGIVGVGGSTNKVLENALTRMKTLIDRSLSEVRLRSGATLDRRRCRVLDMVGEVEVTALFEASVKSIQLHIDVPPDLEVIADRHLVVSAISNLVQNALKFTKEGGNVWIRATGSEELVLIKVEDECGGLPPGKIEELFRPFTQKGEDRTGVGLGLSISRRAIALNDGEVSAMDIPGKGCVFTIALGCAPRDTLAARSTSIQIQ